MGRKFFRCKHCQKKGAYVANYYVGDVPPFGFVRCRYCGVGYETSIDPLVDELGLEERGDGMEEREVVTAKEAGELLDVSATTISRMVRAGDLAGYKLNPGRRNSPLRIVLSSVQVILETRRQSLE